jgi:hypothetical protein
MACPICTDGLATQDSVLTSCGHVYHQACLARWWRQGGDCPLCRTPLPEDETVGPETVVLAADTLDELLLSLAKEVDDAVAAKIVLSAASPDPAFTHAVEATFHRLFDPEHARQLPARLPHASRVTHLLLATQPVLAALLQPVAFKKAKL